MHQLAQRVGLIEAIDQQVEVLRVHLPYHESDHMLGIAYNLLCGGRVCRILSSGGRMRCISMPWARSGFRIRPPLAISAAALTRP